MSSRRTMSLRACGLVLAIVALQRPSPAIGAGELDPTFGTNGTVFTPIGPPGQMAATAYDMVIQSDGAIVVSGGADGRALLARYTTDGVLDATFGDGGLVVSSQGAPGEHFGIAQQADGKLVAVGNDADGRADGSVARYHVDGAPDEDFGTGGFVLTTLGSVGGTFLDVALQPDGSIVTAGYARDADNHAILARYDADGTLDPAFGSGGIAMPALGASAFQGLVRQADGKLVAAGSELVGSTRRMLVARFDTTGALDPTFGAEGIVTTPIGTTASTAHAVTIGPGGTIVVGGEWDQSATVHEVVVARYLSDGQPDASFGTDGVVTAMIGTTADGQDVLVQPDGKTVVVGNALVAGSERFFVARYLANGDPDPDFGVGGVTTTKIGLGDDRAWAVARQADAKIVAAGFATFFRPAVALARYIGEGSLPTTTSSSTSTLATVSTTSSSTSTSNSAHSTTLTTATSTSSTSGSTNTTTSSGASTSTPSSTATTSSTSTSTSSSTTTSTSIPGCTCGNPCEVCSAQLGCHVPDDAGCANALSLRARLILKDDANDARDQLVWKWKGAAPVAESDFGDPTVSSAYALCVLERPGGVPGVKLLVAVPAGGDCGERPCWRRAKGGFRYVDSSAAQDGIRNIQLKAGVAGRAKAMVKGKGANLAMPPLGLATPVTARLVRVGTPRCWEATFGAPTRNDAVMFKARSD